jgi:hypothetical protein
VNTFGFHKVDGKFMACSSSWSGVRQVILCPSFPQFLVTFLSEKLKETENFGDVVGRTMS